MLKLIEENDDWYGKCLGFGHSTSCLSKIPSDDGAITVLPIKSFSWRFKITRKVYVLNSCLSYPINICLKEEDKSHTVINVSKNPFINFLVKFSPIFIMIYLIRSGMLRLILCIFNFLLLITSPMYVCYARLEQNKSHVMINEFIGLGLFIQSCNYLSMPSNT